MARDFQHQNLQTGLPEVGHLYGDRVHILASPLMLSLLAKLGAPSTRQPEINGLTELLYSHLMDAAIDLFFPRKAARIPTRMETFHPEAVYDGVVVDPDVPCVTVDLARAGTFPSHLCYDKLNRLMNPELVRQDHVYVARVTDEGGRVRGSELSGSKIGGGVAGAIVLYPDPMGATGGTIIKVHQHYGREVEGTPLISVALHLIVTPEYLKRVTEECPELRVVALRLDRGLSPPEVLAVKPGLRWEEERGLNSHGYIVPSAGGLGEILNNSFC